MSSSNAAGSSNPRSLLENNEEKNRSVNYILSPYTSVLFADQSIWLSSVVIKVGMVGDSQIGKTSLMVKYVEGSFDEVWTFSSSLSDVPHSPCLPSVSRIIFRPSVRANPPWSMGQTFDIFIPLGVNFMEKTISVRRTTITFSIWDLGGQSSPSSAVGIPLT